MSVRIRLRRMGRKKQPHYRVVVADSHAPRDGRVVENLGYYRPKATPARLVLDLGRVDYWLEQGAEPSDTVRSLVRRARLGGGASLAIGEPDVEAKRKQDAEALAARRASERKEREAKSSVESKDSGLGEPASSSTTNDSAATVTPEGDAPAVEAADAPTVEATDAPAVEAADAPAVEAADAPAVEAAEDSIAKQPESKVEGDPETGDAAAESASVDES